MLIEITAYWPSEEDEITGKVTKPSAGPLVINSDHIVAFDPKDGETLIRLSNGEVFQSTYSFKEFYELMLGIDLSKKLLITEEN